MRPTPFRKAFGALIVAGISRRMKRRGLFDELDIFLEDEAMQAAAVEEVQRLYGDDVKDKGQLLAWLSEHADEIIKIILMLITMFAEQPPGQLGNELTPEQLAEQLTTEFSATGPDII